MDQQSSLMYWEMFWAKLYPSLIFSNFTDPTLGFAIKVGNKRYQEYRQEVEMALEEMFKIYPHIRQFYAFDNY